MLGNRFAFSSVVSVERLGEGQRRVAFRFQSEGVSGSALLRSRGANFDVVESSVSER
jgi:hypothetical protein